MLDRVDYAVGAGNGGFYRASVMHIGDDLLDAALGPARMPRGNTNGIAGVE